MEGAGLAPAGVGGAGVANGGAFWELTEDVRARSRSAAAVLATEMGCGLLTAGYSGVPDELGEGVRVEDIALGYIERERSSGSEALRGGVPEDDERGSRRTSRSSTRRSWRSCCSLSSGSNAEGSARRPSAFSGTRPTEWEMNSTGRALYWIGAAGGEVEVEAI